jgi:hypothetical protein
MSHSLQSPAVANVPPIDLREIEITNAGNTTFTFKYQAYCSRKPPGRIAYSNSVASIK